MRAVVPPPERNPDGGIGTWSGPRSALLASAHVPEALKDAGLRDGITVMIGGAPMMHASERALLVMGYRAFHGQSEGLDVGG